MVWAPCIFSTSGPGSDLAELQEEAPYTTASTGPDACRWANGNGKPAAAAAAPTAVGVWCHKELLLQRLDLMQVAFSRGDALWSGSVVAPPVVPEGHSVTPAVLCGVHLHCMLCV